MFIITRVISILNVFLNYSVLRILKCFFFFKVKFICLYKESLIENLEYLLSSVLNFLFDLLYSHICDQNFHSAGFNLIDFI